MTRQLNNEELKRLREFGQDEALARESKGGQIKFEPIRRIKTLQIGFTGERHPCSGCIEKHGVKYNVKQDIHLTFSHYHGEPSEAIENYCLDCAEKLLKSWDEIMTNDFHARQKFNLEKSLKKK